MKITNPVRRKHSCEQTWKGTRAELFPLLCPVKEREWTPGWDPKLVLSNSGVIEQECLFIEAETPTDAIWIVSKYDPANFDLAMYRVVPGIMVGKFAISLHSKDDETTRATVSYEQTALGKEGEKIVDAFTAESFNAFMDEFMLAINYYITTGTMIDGNELAKQEAVIHHQGDRQP